MPNQLNGERKVFQQILLELDIQVEKINLNPMLLHPQKLIQNVL